MVDWNAYKNQASPASGGVDWNSYKQPEPSGSVDWNGYKQTGPKSFDLGATWNDFTSGATDFAAGALTGAEHVGRNLERFLSPVNQGRAVAGGLDWVFGGRGFGDAYDSMFGGVMNRPTFEQQYEKYGYQPNKEGMFAPYNVGQIAGEAATLPALGGASTLPRALGLGAVEGALGAGILEGGDQLAKQEFDPGKLAATVGLALPFGAAGGAIGHGITKGIGKIADRMGVSKSVGDVGAGGKPYVSADELAARDLINEEEAAILRRYGIDTSAKHIVDDAGNTVQRPTIQHMPRDPFELDQVSSIKSVPGGVQAAEGAMPNPRITDPNSFFDLRARHPDVPEITPEVTGHRPPIEGEVTAHPRMPEDIPQVRPESFFNLTASQSAASPAVSRRFMKGNSGDATNVVFPDELSARVSDLGSKSRKAMSGGDSGIYGNQRMKQLQQEIADELGIDTAQAATIARQFNKAVREQARAGGESIQAPSIRDFVKKAEPPAPMGVELGDYRSPLALDAAGNTIHGQKRGGLGVNIDDPAIDTLLPAEVREMMRTYAGAKAAVEQAKVDAEHMAAKIWEQFGHLAQPKSANNSTPVIKIGNLDIEGPGTVKRPHKAGNDALAKLKYDAADMQVPGLDATARATLDDEFKRALAPSPFKLSANLDDNYPALQKVYETIKEWESKGGNSEKLRKELTEALHGIQADNPALEVRGSVDLGGGKKVNVEYTRGQMQHAFAAEEIPKRAQKIAQQIGKEMGLDADEIQGIAAAESRKMWEKQAERAGLSPADADKAKLQSNQRLEEFLKDRAELKKQLAELGQLDYEKPVKGSIKGTRRKPPEALTRKLAGAMLGLSGAAYLTGNQAAEAYTTGGEPGRRGEQIKEGIAGTAQHDAVSLTLMGAALTAALATPAGRKALKGFVEKGFDLSGRILGDTMDHVGIADAKLGTNLLGELERHNIGALQSMMRVDFGSDTIKSQAMRELSDAVKEGLSQPKQTAESAFHKLSPEAQNALMIYNAQKKTLAKKVREFNKTVRESDADLGPLTKKHLQALEDGLTGKTDNDWLSQFTGQSMDFFFRVNPEFHLLNLTDPYIAGSARVAPTKIMKAQAMLASNSRIKELFKNNNLVGSFKADILENTARSKVASTLKDLDLPSDKVNAASMALGSMLQQMEVHGVKAMPESFVEAVLSNKPNGQITQDIIDKTWIQVADDAMRVLAVDPLRLNRNAFGTIAGARHFAAFINQPARISRLVGEMVKNKDYPKMGRFLLMTTALGGRAAIPKSVRTSWEYYDPDTAYAAESLLDDYSIAGLTGNVAREQVFKDNPQAQALVSALMPDIANKLDYGVLPGEALTMGAFSPGLEAIQKELYGGGMMEDWAKFDRSGDLGDLRKAGMNTLSTAAKTGIAGQIPGLNVAPLGLISRAGKAASEMYDGEKNVYAFDGSKYAGKKTINYDSLFPGARFVVPVSDAIMPGENQIVSGLQLSMKEKAKRKNARRETKSSGNRQAYIDPLSDLRR